MLGRHNYEAVYRVIEVPYLISMRTSGSGSDSAVSDDDRHVCTWEKAEVSDFYVEIGPPDVG
jgi:hypothetical protein